MTYTVGHKLRPLLCFYVFAQLATVKLGFISQKLLFCAKNLSKLYNIAVYMNRGERNMVDKIFAPWRSEYILSGDKKDDGCIFCDYPKQDKDKENLIIFRGKLCFVIMNRYPYNAGHLMVIPYRHLHNFAELTADGSLTVNPPHKF